MVALAGTAFAASLLLLTAINAGPLWRDEVNTANVTQMPTLHDLWNNMESFPPLWSLIVRFCGIFGLGTTDASIRVLGLYVGLAVLGSFWLCARWMGCRAPTLTIALMGSLPSFLFIAGANRAYGLACCLLALSFGTIWRLVEFPSRTRILAAGAACFFFAHCVFYDVVFLAAMLAGGGLVALLHRQWRTLAALAGIGAVSAFTLAIYLPAIRRGAPYSSIFEVPFFSFSVLWDHLRDAVTARGSGEVGRNGPEIWLWIALVLSGLVAAIITLKASAAPAPGPTAVGMTRRPGDLALYCAVSMVVGTGGLLLFLFHLHYWTQSWYYVEMLCLCSLSLDGLWGANRCGLRPWGWLRIGFMAAMMAWDAKGGWAEAHTRRSNVDLIAAVLNKDSADQDIIVVEDVWAGITFNRYYHGAARWVTVPPIDSHLVHRTDLVFEKIHEPDPMASVVRDVANALQGGHGVWLVGNMPLVRPVRLSAVQPALWFGGCVNHWNSQVTGTILDHALQQQVPNITAGQPICYLENLQVVRFSGFKSDAGLPDAATPAK